MYVYNITLGTCSEKMQYFGKFGENFAWKLDDKELQAIGTNFMAIQYLLMN